MFHIFYEIYMQLTVNISKKKISQQSSWQILHAKYQPFRNYGFLATQYLDFSEYLLLWRPYLICKSYNGKNVWPQPMKAWNHSQYQKLFCLAGSFSWTLCMVWTANDFVSLAALCHVQYEMPVSWFNHYSTLYNFKYQQWTPSTCQLFFYFDWRGIQFSPVSVWWIQFWLAWNILNNKLSLKSSLGSNQWFHKPVNFHNKNMCSREMVHARDLTYRTLKSKQIK